MNGESVPSRELSLAELLDALARFWRGILSMTTIGAAIGLVIGLIQTPIYRSEALIFPIKQEAVSGGLGALASQLGGWGQLASLVGVGGGETSELVALLKSRAMARKFIESKGLMKNLYSDKWDTHTGDWRTDLEDPPPTIHAAVNRFNTRIKDVSENKLTGLVTVGIEWEDREIAAEWSNAFVAQVNDFTRIRAIEEATQSIEQLKLELERTDLVEVQHAIFKVIEGHVTRRAMASSKTDFAFRVVDPAVVPEPGTRVRPKRVLLIAIGGASGLVLSVLMALILVVWRGRTATTAYRK